GNGGSSQGADDEGGGGVAVEVDVGHTIPLAIDVDPQRRVIHHDNVGILARNNAVLRRCRRDIVIVSTCAYLAAPIASGDGPNAISLWDARVAGDNGQIVSHIGGLGPAFDAERIAVEQR